MSDKIITEIVLEGEKEAIASIRRVGKAADATFADLKNVQLNFDFIEPAEGAEVADRRGAAVRLVDEEHRQCRDQRVRRHQ